MNDTFGREIKTGDLVAYASDSAGPCLSIGTVIDKCSGDSQQIKVHVFHSNTAAFRQGITDYHTQRVKREPNKAYIAVVGCDDRIVIINGATVPIP